MEGSLLFMMDERDTEAIAAQVRGFYERHPYPPPIDDIEAYRKAWTGERRRAGSILLWPNKPYRDDLTILVAGCGTVQAAHYALRWPRANVTGIDVSQKSIDATLELKAAYGLDNLEVRPLPIERAADLGQTFDLVVSTGVLHHLADPDAGLRALRSVVAPQGALQIMVYAPYGRAGVYMLQTYCKRLGIGYSDPEIDDLAESLRALPLDHPLVPLLRNSPDFGDKAALADALLHPNDRSYSVPQFIDFLNRNGFAFGRWVRQAPYLPWCGSLASFPHHAMLAGLPPFEQYAAIELFRGTMVRHSALAYRSDEPAIHELDFTADEWLAYVPVRLPDTIEVREKLPAGAAAVLINRNHTYTDLYLPVDARQDAWLSGVDGRRSIAEITGEGSDRAAVRSFFQQLWRWDQVVFDTSKIPARVSQPYVPAANP